MKILICCLIYGNRPTDIIESNLSRAGIEYKHASINREGISNALNDGLDLALIDDYEYIGFLANDILEPDNWLLKKVEALQSYPFAGIVASSLGDVRRAIKSEHIISNWLIDIKLVKEIGYFNEAMFPYGPIDLDYCERANIANFNTYYVMDCMAEHIGSHATGTEYGWDKSEILTKNWAAHEHDIRSYRNGTKNIKHDKRTHNKKI
jgi:GT2 family glycosyltransferase